MLVERPVWAPGHGHSTMALSVVLNPSLPHGLDKGHRQARAQWCLVKMCYLRTEFSMLGMMYFSGSLFDSSHSEVNYVFTPTEQLELEMMAWIFLDSQD